jgi:hypothetical protein
MLDDKGFGAHDNSDAKKAFHTPAADRAPARDAEPQLGTKVLECFTLRHSPTKDTSVETFEGCSPLPHKKPIRRHASSDQEGKRGREATNIG